MRLEDVCMSRVPGISVTRIRTRFATRTLYVIVPAHIVSGDGPFRRERAEYYR